MMDAESSAAHAREEGRGLVGIKPEAQQYAEKEVILDERRPFQEQGISPRQLVERPAPQNRTNPTLF